MHVPWLELLPRALRARLAERHVLRGVLGNTGWLLFERSLRVGVGLTVGVWMARYLGPSRFGVLSYATALTFLFAPVGHLGLERVLSRDLARDPEGRRETLGSVFALRLFSGVAACAIATFAARLLRPDDGTIAAITAILSAALVFQSVDGIRSWFDSRMESRYAVVGQVAALLLCAGARVGFILGGGPLAAFAWALSLESLLASIGWLIAYRLRGEQVSTWRATRERTRELLRQSLPMLVGGLATAAHMRLSLLLLGHLAGDEAAGTFAAATRLSEAWFFVPSIAAASGMAAITAAKDTDEALYLARQRRMLRALALLALALAATTCAISPWLVKWLLGTEYAAAGPVLAIHIWTSVFVFVGLGVTPWIINEGLLRVVLWRSLVALTTDAALNLVLIPRYGATGAAISAVAGWCVGYWLLHALYAPTRVIFRMQTRALWPLPGRE